MGFPLLPPFFSQASVEFLFAFLPFLFAAGRGKKREGRRENILGSNGRTPVWTRVSFDRSARRVFPSRMRSLEIAGKFSKVPRRKRQISFFAPLQEKKFSLEGVEGCGSKQTTGEKGNP